MFGFRNFTGIAFVGKIGKFGLEFSAGLVEEVSFNVTSVAVANGAEIPSTIELISKDQFVKGTTAAIAGSKLAQATLFEVIAGATTNLLI